jgi:hypothetical protein
MRNIQPAFNENAEKIVKVSELLEKLQELYGQELSIKEHTLLGFEQPVTLLGRAISLLKPKTKQRAQYQEAAGDGSLGYYKEGLLGMFINTNILPVRAAEDAKFTVTPKLTQKTWDLAIEAAKQCEDYTALRDAGKLKPTRGIKRFVL